jgi:hypothetical protein
LHGSPVRDFNRQGRQERQKNSGTDGNEFSWILSNHFRNLFSSTEYGGTNLISALARLAALAVKI